MAEDSELIGGISVSLGASDSKLIGDLAEAERLVQQWAKQAATVQLRANFAGGAAGAPAGGGGADFSQLTKAIEQGFANFSIKAPTRPQQPTAPRVVAPGVASTAAAGAGSNLNRLINEQLAKQGEVYDELTGEVQKVTDSHRAQRTAVEASTRSTRAGAEAEANIASVDVAPLQAEIKTLVGVLAEFRTALTATAEAAPAASAGGGGGKRRRGSTRAAAPGGDDEEEGGGLGFQTRMAAFELAEGDRQAARVQTRRASRGALAFRESERQRVAEVASTRAQYAKLEDLANDFFSGEEERIGKQEDQQRLQALSNEAQAANNAPRPAPAAAPAARTQQNETPEDRQRRERDERDQAQALAANAPRPRGSRARPAEANALRAAQQRQEQLFASRGAGIISPEDREQRIQEGIEQARANVAAATSTGRTSASRIASVAFGTGGRRLEADVRASAARRELTAANRAALPFEREIATINEDIANATPRVARGLREQRDAFRSDPKVVDAFKRQEQALRGVADATKEYEKLQSGSNIARNLTAIAAGSFLFGAALKAVDLGVQAVGAAVGPTVERLTGFAATTAAYTDNLADATRAANGNAEAVTAMRLASSGLSAVTGRSIQPLIQQRAEVEAGNKALREQIESLHVFQNLRRSSPTAGLGGGTGGFLGTPLGATPGTGEQVGNLLSQQGQAVRAARTAAAAGPFTGTQFAPVGGFKLLGPPQTGEQRRAATPGESAKAAEDFASSLSFVNEQLEKGGDGAAKFSQDLSGFDPRIEQTARAFDGVSDAMAAAIRENGLYSNGIQKQADAIKALRAIDIAGTLPDPELLQQQFNRQRAANIAAAERQQQFTLGTQQPAQQALQNLANPLQPVGTGIAAANAKEQAKITAGQQRSIELQDDLNAAYKQGEQILIDTYKVPMSLINSVRTIGQEIAGVQAGIRNQSAAYQVAQYNFQLHIARRTLSDIGGLTGKNFGAGQSYLGSLEKQNLALSRQGQLLQFNLQQRQINFQTALAGFQTPGVTPEERQARVKEAQIEASFAQKQLDISKQIFGNQVQIVDISNLRQGADLAAQIGLLLQGRALTINTAQAEEKLIRLQQLQAKQVAQVSTYLTKVDNLAALAFGEIQQLELAAGKAMYNVARQVLQAYGVVIQGITSNLPGGTRAHNPEQGATQYNAVGAVGTTSGPMNMTFGEAGSETYAILRNPRAMMGSFGGGGAVSVTFGNVYVRSEADIDEIARKVTRVMGRDAALKGLRSGS